MLAKLLPFKSIGLGEKNNLTIAIRLQFITVSVFKLGKVYCLEYVSCPLVLLSTSTPYSSKDPERKLKNKRKENLKHHINLESMFHEQRPGIL